MAPPPDDRIPARLRLWSLSEDVLVEVGSDGEYLVAFTQWGEIRIDDTSPMVRESLQRMSLGPVAVENLPTLQESYRLWRNGRTGEATEPWYRLTRVLERLGNCVVQSLGFENEAGPVLSVAPVSRQARFLLPREIDADRRVKLSRFGSLRSSGAGLVLESPLTHHRVVLHRPVAACVASSLGAPTTITELAAHLKLAEPMLADLVAYLVASGIVLVGEPGAPTRFAEDDDPDLIPWFFHDLEFHSRSRMNRHNGTYAAAFPPAERLQTAPVGRPRPAGPRFPLFRPALGDLLAGDPPLTEVLEVSRSYRDYSERAVTAQEVGELLFRVARSRATGSDPPAGPDRYAACSRSYLSTADLYELELYVSVDRCAGLPRGSYHYDPDEHALTLIGDSEPELAELLDTAKVAAGSTQRPPVLVTVTTRIARLSWIYSGIAYATSLKHVGALQQTMHLVATAMGLASTALAVDDGAAVDQALRLDWPTEVSVGDFVIGDRR